MPPDVLLSAAILVFFTGVGAFVPPGATHASLSNRVKDRWCSHHAFRMSAAGNGKGASNGEHEAKGNTDGGDLLTRKGWVQV